MRAKDVGVFWVALLCECAIVVAQDKDNVASGHPASVSLEKALDEFLPRYVWGVGLSEETLARGMPKEAIPAPYASKLEMWLGRVLRSERKPGSPGDVVMVGVPKLHYNRDYIVGHVPCGSCDAPDKAKAVEFQADDRSLDLTMYSTNAHVPAGGVWPDAEIVAMVARFLNIPEDRVPHFTAEHHVAEVDGTAVHYGKLNCEWWEGRSSYRQRRWWSEIPFWMVDGKVCVSISIIDWEHGETPPASVNAGLDLSGAVRTEEH